MWSHVFHIFTLQRLPCLALIVSPPHLPWESVSSSCQQNLGIWSRTLACEQAHLFGDFARISWRRKPPFASRRAKRAGERNLASALSLAPFLSPARFARRLANGGFRRQDSRAKSPNKWACSQATRTCTPWGIDCHIQWHVHTKGVRYV